MSEQFWNLCFSEQVPDWEDFKFIGGNKNRIAAVVQEGQRIEARLFARDGPLDDCADQAWALRWINNFIANHERHFGSLSYLRQLTPELGGADER